MDIINALETLKTQVQRLRHTVYENINVTNNLNSNFEEGKYMNKKFDVLEKSIVIRLQKTTDQLNIVKAQAKLINELELNSML